MTMRDAGLLRFAEDLRQEVLSGCELEGAESFAEDQFTELVMGYLADAGEIDDAVVCSHRARGIQVNGYSIADEGQRLDLFVAAYTSDVPPPSVGRTDVDTAFKRLTTFLRKGLDGYHRSLEEASPVFDLALQIYELRETLSRVRMFLLTDGVARAGLLADGRLDGIGVSYHVWDVERLFRSLSSGRQRETVEIDFQEQYGQALPCLATPDENPDYATYLAVLPGRMLVDLYGQHGPRLLERNVRSYLQARGKVNAGIRQSLLREPHMFLAYNNGISATADGVMLLEQDGRIAIESVRNLQIVNGAQTTASIYHAVNREKADVSRVSVQMKLTVLADPSRMDEVVPRISAYANTQNPIQTADFSANDPFHRQVEEQSRTVWAPAAGGTQRQTRWYYERARGQYLDDRERERTPARKKAFEATHPRAQKFAKTDLAKFENTWHQLPHLVSRGAQKNFVEFTLALREKRQVEVDQRYFERLVAKAILFRTAEKLIGALRYGGYRANIVTYTLAWISHATALRVDLDRIWRDQGVSPALRDAIEVVSRVAHEHIVDPPGNANVTEWCKKEECWRRFRDREIALPAALEAELLPLGPPPDARADRLRDPSPAGDEDALRQVLAVPAEAWLAISAWAKQTDNLQPWQRSLAYSLGRLSRRGQAPTGKQAVQGARILGEAERLGFAVPDRLRADAPASSAEASVG